MFLIQSCYYGYDHSGIIAIRAIFYDHLFNTFRVFIGISLYLFLFIVDSVFAFAIFGCCL